MTYIDKLFDSLIFKYQDKFLDLLYQFPPMHNNSRKFFFDFHCNPTNA